jgi:hypothetical protein
MKALLILSLLFTATIANAQELTIKATPAEADLIWKGLRELPVKDVEGLMAKIRQQVAEQTTPKVVEPKKE